MSPISFLVLLCLPVSIARILGLGLPSSPRFTRNDGVDEYGPFMEPAHVVDGLATYDLGDGEPVLLIPYPHGHTAEPMSEGPLARILVRMGRRVITFDPPGAFGSTREPTVDMAEMIACAIEALEASGVRGPLDVVGHSMGGLVSLGIALERPDLVQSLVLISSFSGFPSAIRHGLPGSCYRFWELDYWRLVFWGLRVQAGLANLSIHKRLQNLMEGASFYDGSFFSPLEIHPGDDHRGVPIRMGWTRVNAGITYEERLGEVEAETLVIAGRHDPESPLACSEELREGIGGARLVIFEGSGHHPFIEEEVSFTRVLSEFLGR